jgi:2-isopropylmalate synthase
VYDCTLREGSQASQISFSLRDKLRIAQLFDDMGFTYTEGGWPSSNAKDEMFFTAIQKVRLRHIKIVGFGRTRLGGIAVEQDVNLNNLVATGIECGHIFGKGWDFQVREVLRISPQENLDAIHESVHYLKQRMGEVSFGFEHFFDAYKSNLEYTHQVMEAAISAGVDWIDLADTNGGCFPHEIAEIVSAMVARYQIPFAVHCHDDTGCAVANTIAAVRNGAQIVEGTVNGYSERCGMADLCTIIPNLQLKLGYQLIPDENLRHLTRLAKDVADIVQTEPPVRHPYVGTLAFTHKGGTHVDAFLKNPRTYEHIDPALVGNRSDVVVSEVSGKANLMFFLRKHGLTEMFGAAEVAELLVTVKALELSGFDFNTVEEALLLLILRESKKLTRHVELEDISVMFRNSVRAPRSESASDPSATGAATGAIERVIVDRRKRRSLETDAIEVSGKLAFPGSQKPEDEHRFSFLVADENTSFSWVVMKLAEACAERFPALAASRLVDYKIRAIDSKQGHPYRIRVILEFTENDGETWRMLGLGRNVVSATLNAAIDAFEFKLNIDELRRRQREAAPR